MKVLLDSHALIWALDDPERLGVLATATLSEPTNELLVSAASLWEIAIKVRIGKLKLSESYRAWMNRALADLQATLLPITVDHCHAQVNMADRHRDPFDCLLVAQAIAEDVPIVSLDAALDIYGIRRLW